MKKLYFLVLCVNAISSTYYSQYQQDKLLNEHIFKNKRNGIFVDIGAHDGISINNTYFYEKELGWTGICIEPIPAVFERLRANRNCICINGGIASFRGKGKFLNIMGAPEMLSGLVDKYASQHALRVDYELARDGGKKQIIEIECFKLNDLLEEYNLHHVDYLSIDTEGGELEILKSIDYKKYDISVIDVENNYNDPEFGIFMASQGYALVGKLCCDEIYCKMAPMQENA